MTQKILVIKLGAKGDVIRTLSILPAMKKKFPESEITWITKSNISDLLGKVENIDRVLTIPLDLNEEFDILYNLDIEKEATDLAINIKSNKKYGFYSEGGYPAAFNMGTEYYLNTLFDDELKKNNKKTYQEMIFELAELPYDKELCGISLTEESTKYAQDFLKLNNLDNKKIIGLHMGSSPRWPSKAWSEERVKEFIKKAGDKGYKIILFGGPDEIESHPKIIEELKLEGYPVARNNPFNSNSEFASLINLCDKVVCSDSFALHIALALKKEVIGLFFCTSPDEVEDYGLLKKIIATRIYEFFPEKMNLYDEDLVKSISADEVLKNI
ncbi:hypothetical protein AUJ84_01980 [Candidatus Pacearchaeota archaeon CG1_02_32_132]|nr:MAG: hypothetical protein AUJ84_01980 [Candidatus Pacearchaeota archaeon CG1_02_32_132]